MVNFSWNFDWELNSVQTLDLPFQNSRLTWNYKDLDGFWDLLNFPFVRGKWRKNKSTPYLVRLSGLLNLCLIKLVRSVLASVHAYLIHNGALPSFLPRNKFAILSREYQLRYETWKDGNAHCSLVNQYITGGEGCICKWGLLWPPLYPWVICQVRERKKRN